MDAPLYRECRACGLERGVMEFCVFAPALPCGHGLDVCACCVCQRTEAHSCLVCGAPIPDEFLSVAASLAAHAFMAEAPAGDSRAAGTAAAAFPAAHTVVAPASLTGNIKIAFLSSEALSVAVNATTTVAELMDVAAERLGKTQRSRVILAVDGGSQSICMLETSTAAAVGVHAGVTLHASLPRYTLDGSDTRPVRFSLSYTQTNAKSPAFMDVMAVVVGPDENSSICVSKFDVKRPAGVTLCERDNNVMIDVQVSELHSTVRAVFFLLFDYQKRPLNRGAFENVRALLQRYEPASGAVTQLATVSMADLPTEPGLIAGALRRVRVDDLTAAIEFIEMGEPCQHTKSKDLKRTFVQWMDAADR